MVRILTVASNNNMKSFFNNLKNQRIKFLAMSNWYNKYDN